MRDTTIARNYAEVLLTLAGRAGDPHGWEAMIGDVRDMVRQDADVREFLESPRISDGERVAILGRAFQDRFPRPFVRFLQAVVQRRRQMLLPEIALEYRNLLDASEGRVHADITLARPVDDAWRGDIAARLSQTLGRGKTVVPHVRVNPRILGGAIVRIGDTVADGSVRTRLSRLQRQLVGQSGGR
jgi:F-type H+-transporting ATPase subunit delta